MIMIGIGCDHAGFPLKQEVIKQFKLVTSKPANFDYIREQIQGYIEQVIYDKTGRQPMVLPLVIEV